jgi:hypothetical protein
MESDRESARRTLAAAILAAAIQSTHDSDETLNGAVLVGFVVLAEWMDPEGRKWMSSNEGNGDGSDGLVSWQVRGYLTERLHF